MLKKIKFNLICYFLFLLTSLFFLPQKVKARNGGVPESDGGFFKNFMRHDTFVELFIAIANWLVGIVGVLAILMIVIGGFQFIFSGGNAENIEKAKKTIYWAIFGLIIALAAYSILDVILGILETTSAISP